MVKIKDLDEEELTKQIEKYNRIIKALRRERAKRDGEERGSHSTQTGLRVRKTGTVTDFKFEKVEKEEKTNSSLYQLTMDEEELTLIQNVQKNRKPPVKQMTISKLIILNQENSLHIKDEDS